MSTLDILSKILPCIKNKKISIPSVLKKQVESASLSLGRIDVEGDGYCGYYCIQILEYIINGNMVEISVLENIRNKVIQSLPIKKKVKESLVKVKRHYLEYIEIGLISQYLWKDINVGIVVQTDFKKSGYKRRKRVYPIRVVNYTERMGWVFLVMTHGARHYELLSYEQGERHRFVFTENEAKEFFICCETEFPTEKIESKNHIEFLDTKDFVYF